MEHKELTGRIIGVCYDVARELGHGFLESVYQKALAMALAQTGLRVAQQVPLKVWFRGEIVGEFLADIIVEDTVILELKAVSELASEHSAQLINYLKASGYDTGLVINFGQPSVDVKRCWRPHSPVACE